MRYGLSYDDAMTLAQTGVAVRARYMSKGWKVQKIDDGLYCINPHTGSNYEFRPRDIDRINKWEKVNEDQG